MAISGVRENGTVHAFGVASEIEIADVVANLAGERANLVCRAHRP